MDIIITIVGLAIGMLIGGLILFSIIRNARKQCMKAYEEEEKMWFGESGGEMSDVSDEEISEK